jgi:hydrogenase maturation protease
VGIEAEGAGPHGPATLFILGYGNPGRRDDGLGPYVAEALEESVPGDVTVETAFQPGLEHCAAISKCRTAVFIDSARKGRAPFEVRRLEPALDRAAFTTHAVCPAELLGICAESFGARPPAWLVAVRGYSYGMGEGLSGRAKRNAARAVDYLQAVIAGGEVFYG